ncbi:DUF3592 domain-containing protein [Oscillatoria amoena NRMC-F 0135]|nr:DUF3592 domain-containing protein [Oscillatoria amoena NRMC-F 0135]
MKMINLPMGIICGLLGIGFAFVVYKSIAFHYRGISVAATVIDHVEDQTINRDETFCCFPLVEYVTLAGDTLQQLLPRGSDPPEYEIGEKLIVYYLPEHPAQINDGITARGTIVAASVAVLMLFLSGFGWYRYFKSRKKKKLRAKQRP